MSKYGQAFTSQKRKKVEEGSLIKVLYTPDIRVRIQDPLEGHLEEVAWEDSPIVGVVTRMWKGGHHGIRELELMCSGCFLLLTTNNGLGIDEIEVLS